MKKIIIISLALLVAGAASVRAADAKENWEKNCSKCHGTDGKGKTKMGEKLAVKDYTDAKVQDGLKDDAMTKAIKDGVKDGEKTKMKGFGEALSDDEVKALVKFVAGHLDGTFLDDSEKPVVLVRPDAAPRKGPLEKGAP